MITTPTVFVLGAGASIPYGFPSGGDLVRKIWQNSDPEVRYPALDINRNLYDRFRTELKNSMQPSVDAFLEHRPEFQEIGKKAIAFYLTACETEQAFGKNDWYQYILNRMTANTTFDDLGHNKLSFVTFNYDRSLEAFLYTSLLARYGKPPAEVAAVVSKFQIIHVHGQLGLMPWQSNSPNVVREFNNDCTVQSIRIAANGIKIISENLDSTPDFAAAQTLMGNASRIAFMGFGYHPTNMKRLNPPLGGIPVWGTCYGMTQAESQHLQNVTHLGLAVFPNMTCYDFLRNCPHLQRD